MFDLLHTRFLSVDGNAGSVVSFEWEQSNTSKPSNNVGTCERSEIQEPRFKYVDDIFEEGRKGRAALVLCCHFTIRTQIVSIFPLRAITNNTQRQKHTKLHIRRTGAVTPAAVDQFALGGGSAHTTAAARKTRTAALGLALIVFEQKEAVVANLKLGAHQGLIGRGAAPVTEAVLGLFDNIVVCANGNILVTGGRTAQDIIRETFRSGIVGVPRKHEHIGDQK